MIPAPRSCASVIWRCDVDGGWTTIVWTLPSEAVSSVRAIASMTARPAVAAADDLDGEHPAERVRAELAYRDVVLRMAGETGIEDALHAVLTLEPGRQCRGGPRVALGAHGEGQDPAQDEERVERSERRRRCRSGPSRPRRMRSARPATTPAMTSLWPARNFVADSTTRSAPSSSGRHTYGEANVLSTMYVAPCSWAMLGERRVVGHDGRRVGDGLGVDDPGRCGRDGRRPPRSCRSGRRSRRRPRSAANVSTSCVRVEP